MDTISGSQFSISKTERAPVFVAFSPLNKYSHRSMCASLVCYSFPPQVDPGQGPGPFHLWTPVPSPASAGVNAEFAEWPILRLMSPSVREALGPLHRGLGVTSSDLAALCG